MTASIDSPRVSSTGDYKRIYGDDVCDAATISLVSRVKRFLEMWSIDDKFRDGLTTGIACQGASDLNLDIEDLRPLWDPGCQVGETNKIVNQYISFSSEKLLLRDRIRDLDGRPEYAGFRQWRQRQINRFFRQVGVQLASAVVHAPFSIELNQGCSVGCWFCGVDAPKLGDIFSYTDENKFLWRDLLRSLHQSIGFGAKAGFCYWATDPLDNPDYEKFIQDFKHEFGRFPQTTTAQPLKHLERVRELIRMTSGAEKTINRFSVLSINSMRKIHEYFTPEELVHVELVPQNKEAMAVKANAGRARGKLQQLALADQETNTSTIACVSGFLINMVRKSIKLITPVPASDQWPLGYQVFGEEFFTDAQSFDVACQKLFGLMKIRLLVDDQISIDGDFECLLEGSQIVLRQNKYSFKLSGTSDFRLLSSLVDLLTTSPLSVLETIIRLEDIATPPITMHLIDTLFRAGIVNHG